MYVHISNKVEMNYSYYVRKPNIGVEDNRMFNRLEVHIISSYHIYS